MVLMIVIWIWESLDGLITRKAGAAGHRSIQCPQLWPSQQWSHSLTLQLTIAAARHHGALQICRKKTPVNFGQPCLRHLTRRGKHWKMTNRSRFSSAAGCCLSCRIFLHSFKDIYQNCKYFCSVRGHMATEMSRVSNIFISAYKYFYLGSTWQLQTLLNSAPRQFRAVYHNADIKEPFFVICLDDGAAWLVYLT